MKSIDAFLFFWVVCLSSLSWSASSDDYRNLRTAYQGALDQVDEGVDRQREQVFTASAEKLDALAADFKSSGNIGFHLEARNVAERIRRGTFHTVQPEKLMSGEVQELYRGIQSALDQVEEAAGTRIYQIQKVMVTQLEGMAGELERAGEQEVAQLARAEQKSILENEDYVAMQQAEEAAARAVVRRPRAIPTPVPQPVVVSTGKPMLEVDVFKKSLSDIHNASMDYDDQEQNIQFTVQVRSRELVKNYGALKVEVWGFGRHVNSKKMYKMILTDTLSIPSLERGAREEVETKSVRNVYDNNETAQYGYKFYGYVCRVTEKETGKILFTKTSPSRMERYADQLMSEWEGSQFTL